MAVQYFLDVKAFKSKLVKFNPNRSMSAIAKATFRDKYLGARVVQWDNNTTYQQLRSIVVCIFPLSSTSPLSIFGEEPYPQQPPPPPPRFGSLDVYLSPFDQVTS